MAICIGTERSAIAPGSSSAGTSSGGSAPAAGLPIALPTPVAAASAKYGQSRVAPEQRHGTSSSAIDGRR